VAEVDYRNLQDAAVDRVWMCSGAQRDAQREYVTELESNFLFVCAYAHGLRACWGQHGTHMSGYKDSNFKTRTHDQG
jgi:hypothetical protein